MFVKFSAFDSSRKHEDNNTFAIYCKTHDTISKSYLRFVYTSLYCDDTYHRATFDPRLDIFDSLRFLDSVFFCFGAPLTGDGSAQAKEQDHRQEGGGAPGQRLNSFITVHCRRRGGRGHGPKEAYCHISD